MTPNLVGETSAPEATTHPQQGRTAERRELVVLAGVTTWSFVIAAVFVGVPAYWWDEAATVLMAGRPWDSFTATIRNVDAVHAAYYLLMRGWAELFGFGTLAMRLPSAAAVAATSLVLVHLGRAHSSMTVGVLAGIIYPLIPAVVWAAGEARSFALSALLAALVLLTLVRALDRPTDRWRWALLALAITAASWTFLFSILMVPGALIFVTREQWRRRWPAITAATVAALAGTVPLALFAAGQRRQVSWIPDAGWGSTLETILTEQYLRGTGQSFALLFWGLLAIGVVIAWTTQQDDRRLIVAYATIVGVPTLALALSGPVLGEPMYVQRYLLFTAPALVMLVALVLARRSMDAIAVILVILLVVGAGPSLRSRLDPMSKSSWPLAVETLGSRAEPGDAMIAFSSHLTGARAIYPESVGSLPLLNETVTPQMAPQQISPSTGGPISDLVVPADVRRIWYLSDAESRSAGRSDIDADLAWLAERGFVPTFTSDPRGAQQLVIILLERP